VQTEDGSLLEYTGIGDDLWHRFKSSGAQWSFYRDNIEEEFVPKRVPAKSSGGGKNPLDDLFK